MPSSKILALLTYLLSCLAPTAVLAQQALEAKLVRELSHCDRSFFVALAGDLYEVSRLGNVEIHRDFAYFKVPNRRIPAQSMVRFHEPLVLDRLEIVGYFDDIVDVNARTSLVSWGFLVRSNVRDAAAALRPYIWDSDRLRLDDGIYVRSEVWTEAHPELEWQKLVTEAGEPKPGTMERVLLIEPSGDSAGLVRVGCSLQGSVTSEMVQSLRPDLVE